MEQEQFEVGSKLLDVWPRDLKISRAGDDTCQVFWTKFNDTEAYHQVLIDKVHELALQPVNAKQYSRHMGGTKIYQLDQWGSEEASFVNERALALFKGALPSDEAVVDLSWANVSGQGDYSIAHSHIRSTASVVYCLDPGDPDPRDPESGLLTIIDPRFSPCCELQKGLMTNPFCPNLTAGSMIIFPSHLVHCVNSYGGERPRITFAWNINRQAVPGSFLDAQQQAAQGRA